MRLSPDNQPSHSAANSKEAIRVLFIILFLNLLVAFAKIIIGSMTQSGSITADGYHSLSDGSGNIVGMIGLFIASRPVDKNHPYGHKKFETMASLFIATLLFFVGGKVAIGGFERIFNPIIPEITSLSFAVMVATLVVNVFVVTYEASQGRKLQSDVLVSDSQHTKSDLYITTGVLFTMTLIRFGIDPRVDGLVSMIISFLIIKAGYDIFKASSNVLTDAEALDSEEIRAYVLTIDKVIGCHKVRSRGRADDIHIDLHVQTDPNMTVFDAHALDHFIGQCLRDKYGETVSVIVHIEPFDPER